MQISKTNWSTMRRENKVYLGVRVKWDSVVWICRISDQASCEKLFPGCSECQAKSWGTQYEVMTGNGDPRDSGVQKYGRKPNSWLAQTLSTKLRSWENEQTLVRK